jgi:hypothetical protein
VPRLPKACLATCVAAVLSAMMPAPASAGFFEMLFGAPSGPRAAAPPALETAPRQPAAASPRKGTGGQAYCVRECDGFFFPMPGGATAQLSPQALCDGMCAGSVVYRLSRRGPNEGVDEARSPTGSRYGDLATAYSYRTAVTPACGCGSGIRQDWALRALEDPTLRRGDVVVSDQAAFVFRGDGKRGPTTADFVDLRSPGATPPALLAQADRVLGFSFQAEVARRGALERVKVADRSLEITVTATPKKRTEQAAGSGTATGPRVILEAPYTPR